MSIHIVLDSPPEFYTNLDLIKGSVLLNLSRHEHVGAIVVKLEGESRTALAVPTENPGIGIGGRERHAVSGDTLHENHKILYRVAQVFPDESAHPAGSPFVLNPGQHRFPFQFKFPFNNACGDLEAMARIGGVGSVGGLFGVGFRVMDGTKQLMYSHVTKTLPPSFTGFPGEAEIRYYLKVTVQRPGIFKENWRHQVGLKFLPIEPPRPPNTNQEAYARRPFAFSPKRPDPVASQKKRSSIFSWTAGSSTPSSGSSQNLQPPAGGLSGGPPSPTSPTTPPSIEMSARLPHPAILTCNKPIPLRLIAKKLVPASAEVYLVALQIELVGTTTVRCHNLINREISRWVIMARQGLSILLSKPEDPVGQEVLVPDSLWSGCPLPNTVMPSFVTCNLRRDYQLELRLGLAWGRPSPPSQSTFFGRSKYREASEVPQELHLPLHFSTIEVYSGLAPPPALVEAIRQGRGRGRTANPAPGTRPTGAATTTTTTAAAAAPTAARPQSPQKPPELPPRPPPEQQPAEALYPPQLAPGQAGPPYDDAPPTYEEAMAEEMTGPMFPPGAPRPAYSGVTDENGPGSLDAARGPVGGEKG
ncbi:hypothetical protein VTH06DRAFT_4545 [Thermothelomyces fergusii]